jgi:phosphoribosyl 1,2-cyclic phosphodiesterase
MMKVKFWGARGSIPSPLTGAAIREKIRAALLGAVGIDLTDHAAVDQYIQRLPLRIASTAGGNTTCVELRVGQSLFILDGGSGVRMLSNELMSGDFGRGKGVAHIFVSHTHWDHIQGFPFFFPAYVPGNQLHFHSPFPDLKTRFEDQQREIYYPVSLDYMGSIRSWQVLDPNETIEIDGVKISMILLSHPGGAYAYRFSKDGHSIVYATDGEYQKMDQDSTARYVEFFRDADALIFDAQYSFEQVIDDRRDWGHSTPKMGAELAFRANVKRLVLTHHDPMATDDKLWDAVTEAYNYLAFRSKGMANPPKVEVLLAQEGLEIALD